MRNGARGRPNIHKTCTPAISMSGMYFSSHSGMDRLTTGPLPGKPRGKSHAAMKFLDAVDAGPLGRQARGPGHARPPLNQRAAQSTCSGSVFAAGHGGLDLLHPAIREDGSRRRSSRRCRADHTEGVPRCAHPPAEPAAAFEPPSPIEGCGGGVAR